MAEWPIVVKLLTRRGVAIMAHRTRTNHIHPITGLLLIVLFAIAGLRAPTPTKAQVALPAAFVSITKQGDQITVNDSNGNSLPAVTTIITVVEIPQPYWSNGDGVTTNAGIYLWGNPQGNNVVKYFEANPAETDLGDLKDQAKQIWFESDGQVTIRSDNEQVTINKTADQISATDSSGSSLPVTLSKIVAVEIPTPFWSNGDAASSDVGFYLWANPQGRIAVKHYAGGSLQPLGPLQDQAKEVWFVNDGEVRIHMDQPITPSWTFTKDCPHSGLVGQTLNCKLGATYNGLIATFPGQEYVTEIYLGETLLKSLPFNDVGNVSVGPLTLGQNHIGIFAVRYDETQTRYVLAGDEFIITGTATPTQTHTIGLPFVAKP